MNTASLPMYEWNTIPWAKAEREVFKLQKRIYQASQRDNRKAIHQVQRLLMTSWWACVVAVRKVSQDNQGKKTAGVDGLKSLTPSERLALARQLHANPLLPKSPPVRRVWIPKPGTSEQRPLGIPTMEQRARQALVKLVLEPEWEAQFEPNSYGFRPGRSAHDAIEAIFKGIRMQAKFVLDADIAKCFDRISHSALLAKLQTFPRLHRVIKAWLEAGIMDEGTLFPSMDGVPQGGCISPLLANVALHGLETAVAQRFRRQTANGSRRLPLVVRYADDLVALDVDETVIHQVKAFIAEWLQTLGLELKPSKTQITHTLDPYNGSVGFDFLGFEVRQYRVGRARSARNGKGQRLGFKTLIKPSKASVRRHVQALAAVVDQHRQAPQAGLIARLNPKIKGWANYYATVCSKATLRAVDCHLFHKLWAWARRRHPNKGSQWRARKYWGCHRGSWAFAAGPLQLRKSSHTRIRRHTKVQGHRSPFDGDWLYWATRHGKHPQLPARIAMLLKRQQGRCAYCGLYFRDEDLLEQDHIWPRAFGGVDRLDNLQLLHRHCHDCKTAKDLYRMRGDTDDNSQRTEEPGEPKGSCPVLKTSRSGDGVA
jgi:RNA-directed DNA polymerase